VKPFKKAPLPDYASDPEWYMKTYGIDREQAEKTAAWSKTQEVWLNDQYQVNVRRLEPTETSGFPAMIHLSVKRRDKGSLHDWRHLQQIKNMIVGPEHEAVELYPAESRLVDTANQYHLWVLADPTIRFPFGFHDGRAVTDEELAASLGAKQRPLKGTP
jgi:hypothetical protein